MNPAHPATHISAPDVLDHLPDAVVVVDASGTLVWGNRAAERLREGERSKGRWAGSSISTSAGESGARRSVAPPTAVVMAAG